MCFSAKTEMVASNPAKGVPMGLMTMLTGKERFTYQIDSTLSPWKSPNEKHRLISLPKDIDML